MSLFCPFPKMLSSLIKRLITSDARTLKLLERRKVTTLDIGILKKKKKAITMVTAYDYPSAVHVDLAGIDILLVGDSVGMVEMVFNIH